jgi:hypothetical protein
MATPNPARNGPVEASVTWRATAEIIITDHMGLGAAKKLISRIFTALNQLDISSAFDIVNPLKFNSKTSLTPKSRPLI